MSNLILNIRNFFYTLFFITIFLYLSAAFSKGGDQLEIIRDVELESFTNEIIDSLLTGSDITSDDLNIYFINSDEINAFVTSGSDMFIHIGLILSADDYREYVSVIAHELSHIIGSHVSRTKNKIENLSNNAFPVYLLGVLGIMSGSPDAGLAAIMVGQAGVSGNYLVYSRTQEAAADQGTIRLMCDNDINASNLLSFLKKLENLYSTTQTINPYNITHPITSDRYTWVKSGLKKYKSCSEGDSLNPQMQKRFDLVRAKLFGYIKSNKETSAVYKSDNQAGKYSLSVSNFLIGKHDISIKYLKDLITINNINPFYRELLAEIYFSKNMYEEAIFQQNEAIKLIKNENDLLYMMKANYLLALMGDQNINEAIISLKKSIRLNNENSYSWYLLAKAYAQISNIPLAQYATAERYFLINEIDLAYKFVVNSLKGLEKNTTEWYRANDLLHILDRRQVN